MSAATNAFEDLGYFSVDNLPVTMLQTFARLVTGSEDFAYMLEKVPGCFVRLGNGNSPMVHTSRFDFNDDNLTVGAAYWTRLAERFLAG